MSSTSLIMERGHLEVGTVPVADAFSTTTGTSDVINMKDHNRVRFLVFWGVGATGTVKFTVEACDNVTPSTTSAIPFWYRITASAGTPGAITRVATGSDGVTNTAGSNQIIEIEAVAADMASLDYGFIRLKATEVVDSPILGGVLIELLEPRHAGASATSAVT
jgi:hypothetical protein